jgi:hypothetical protein
MTQPSTADTVVKRVRPALKMVSNLGFTGWSRKTDAALTGAKFVICDPGFHQGRYFYRDFHLILIK